MIYIDKQDSTTSTYAITHTYILRRSIFQSMSEGGGGAFFITGSSGLLKLGAETVRKKKVINILSVPPLNY